MNDFEQIYSNTLQIVKSLDEEHLIHEHEKFSRSQYLNGPDQVIPSESLVTSKIDGTVKLRMDSSGMEALKPISLPGLLHKVALEYPDNIAMVCKDEDGVRETITYKEYEEQVRICAKAFLKLGLQRHHSVGILGFNSKEWVISLMAAIHAGGIAAGIYTTNSPDACCHCLKISDANIVVVEDACQLEKILKVKQELPQLKIIIQYSSKPTIPGVYSWDDIMKTGSEESDEMLDKTLKTIAINECCSLVFTSGTTGYPKAAMLSHDNLLFCSQIVTSYLGIPTNNNNIFISYLPLSHIMFQVGDIYIPLHLAGTVYFADKDVLKGSLMNTLHEARPTFFPAVPRVWEKMHEKILKVGSQSGIIRRHVSNWARSHILEHNLNKMNGVYRSSISYFIASNLIHHTVKETLGFDRCKVFITGGAPISVEIKKFFMSLDIIVMEGFGMSESSGIISIGNLSAFNLTSVGKTVTGLHTKIYNPDNAGEGEICCYGRVVFMGYLKDPEKTKEALDENGWLHSGDTGRIDKQGFLYVTGRIKELIITAGGENISPAYIENIVKAELPCVNNAVLIGDRRKFLSILLTLKTDVDTNTGEPKDQLIKQVKDWCQSFGCNVNTVSEIIQGPDKKVMSAIEEGLDRVNKKMLSKAQHVQKFAILPKDFSIQTGELGSTLKIKRNAVIEKYADIIDNFYKNC